MRQHYTKAGTPYHFDKQGNVINQYGQRDVLLGMAIAGEQLAELPLINIRTNNWARMMMRKYSCITSTFSDDTDYVSLNEAIRFQKQHQRSRENPRRYKPKI